MTMFRAIAIAATLLVAACEEQGTYYEVAPSQAKASIKAAVVPTHVLGSTIKRSRAYDRGDDQVVTALIDGQGRELMHFVTTVTPDGEGSRVDTEIEMTKDADTRSFEATYALALLDKLADEHVAAAIEGRPFDMLFATNPAAVAMMGPEMRDEVESANRAMQELNESQQMGSFGSESGSGSDWGAGGGDWGN